jgi:hypothetical protein
MSNIFGSLGVSDSDYVFSATQGQRVIFEAATAYVAEQNAALNAVVSTFVDRTTSDHIMRYKLPGGGMLQKRGGQAQSGATKATGSWDVAFPLSEYGDQIAGDDVSLAYMTVAELDRHFQTVVTRNINTVRYELLKTLFTPTNTTFVDPNWGALTCVPLANGDAVVYPPVVGSATEATDNHYLPTVYLAAGISDTNDPISGFVIPELEEHFGQVTGGAPIVVFINTAQVAKISALAAMVGVVDNYVIPGANTDTPILPPTVPGRILGRHMGGAWVVQWDWIPSDFILGVHLDAPKPLYKRVDPPQTGLPADLTLVSQDEEYPFRVAHWRNRFGFGVANRLSAIALKLHANTYAVPAAYA